MFEVQNLRYRHILDIPYLHIRPHALTCILGESGSGKTTLLKMFNRMLSPDSGRIVFQGRELEYWASVALRRTLPMLPQTPVIFPGSIRDNVLAGLRLSGSGSRGTGEGPGKVPGEVPSNVPGEGPGEGPGKVPRAVPGEVPGAVPGKVPGKPEEDRIRELLDALKLKKKPEDNAQVLSGGERQRLSVARLVLMDTDAALLDEPSAALDDNTEDAVLHFLASLVRREGKTLVVVTHSRHMAETCADEILSMEELRRS